MNGFITLRDALMGSESFVGASVPELHYLAFVVNFVAIFVEFLSKNGHFDKVSDKVFLRQTGFGTSYRRNIPSRCKVCSISRE
jgi:hypothetical protein